MSVCFCKCIHSAIKHTDVGLFFVLCFFSLFVVYRNKLTGSWHFYLNKCGFFFFRVLASKCAYAFVRMYLCMYVLVCV